MKGSVYGIDKIALQYGDTVIVLTVAGDGYHIDIKLYGASIHEHIKLEKISKAWGELLKVNHVTI